MNYLLRRQTLFIIGWFVLIIVLINIGALKTKNAINEENANKVSGRTFDESLSTEPVVMSMEEHRSEFPSRRLDEVKNRQTTDIENSSKADVNIQHEVTTKPKLSLETSQWIFRPEKYRMDNIQQTGAKYLMMYSRWPELHARKEHQKRESHPDNCPYDKCVYTRNISKADVLIFEAFDLKNYPLQKLPPRPPNQEWLIWTVDPVINDFGLDNDVIRSQFNLTTSYRQESDIPEMLGFIGKKKEPIPKVDYKAIFRNKTKLAAWFVSNCKTPSKRELYVWRMSNLAQVDIFGLCGPNKCGTNHFRMDTDVPKCFPMLTHTYKFYLAFESHFCEQYVTEKFFKLFYPGTHVIPVVRGSVDYNNAFPKDTFVNANDFDSPEALTKYLKKLGDDEEAYTKMLEAKDKWTLVEDVRSSLRCRLCQHAHTNRRTRTIADIQKAYIGDPKGCQPPSDLGSGPWPDKDLRQLMGYSIELTGHDFR